ncbi:uncharacterized protein PV09_07796 [Verruconis gallopava]|uniref:Zn(2)-C6 fungal-type domain-containing protein n=1 Tax=Verruconis gallopava TaxID=253628 RepID=A0A0D2A1M0_9PEZI|nr:uncharacterized protein PV09_07796 [Verruconis gallopava]KIW00598.1 hypothetical protein PV09_07796 [Verruconis gallopava]
MEKELTTATNSETQAWRASSTPSDFSQSANAYGDSPRRRQYQSCDYCRKRRRACNAIRLGINPFKQGQDDAKEIACTTCHRANRSCTFNWLLDGSKKLPPGIKIQLPAQVRKIPTENETLKTSRPSVASSSASVSAESPTSGVDKAARCEKNEGYPAVHHRSPPNVVTAFFVGKDPFQFSVPENVVGQPESEGGEVQSFYPTPWSSTPLSVYDIPPAEGLTQHPWETRSAVIENLSHIASRSDEVGGSTASIGAFYEEDLLEESEDPKWRLRQTQGLRHERRQEESYMDSVNTRQAIADVVPRQRPSFLAGPELNLTSSSIKSFFIAGLKKIYENSMETSLSCWVTRENSPYEKRIWSLRRRTASRISTDSTPSNLYQRAYYLDNVLSTLRPNPLTAAENALASEVLGLAVLAFASQWPSSTRSSSQGGVSAADISEKFTTPKLLDSNELEYMIRQSLWTQLNKCLTRLSDCDSFRVITAKLILFFITRPLNWEEKILMEEFINADALPKESRGEASAKVDSQDAAAGTQSSKHSTKRTSRKPQTLFDLLNPEDPIDHLSVVMQQLSTWSTRIKIFLHRTSLAGQTANIPLLNQLEHVRRAVLQACPQFNLLFWFSIMLDTARSTLHRRPLVFVDTETENHIIKHDPQDLPSTEDPAGNQEASSSGVGSLTRAFQRLEIWQPLQQMAPSPCDDPFECPRTDFEKRMASVLQEATPMTVLIIRKVAHLQAAISASSTDDEIERCIAEILNVCGTWNVRYGQFLDNCIAEHTALPFTVRSWYITTFGHWYVGYLRGIELIDDHDTRSASHTIQRSLRLSTCLILRLQKEASYRLAEIAHVSCQDIANNVIDRTNREYHSSIRPGSILTEPAPDVMIFGLKSACDIMLTWLRILREPVAPLDARAAWVQTNIEAHDMVRHIRSCVDAMNQLGRLSSFAEVNGKVYGKRLDDLVELESANLCKYDLCKKHIARWHSEAFESHRKTTIGNKTDCQDPNDLNKIARGAYPSSSQEKAAEEMIAVETEPLRAATSRSSVVESLTSAFATVASQAADESIPIQTRLQDLENVGNNSTASTHTFEAAVSPSQSRIEQQVERDQNNYATQHWGIFDFALSAPSVPVNVLDFDMQPIRYQPPLCNSSASYEDGPQMSLVKITSQAFRESPWIWQPTHNDRGGIDRINFPSPTYHALLRFRLAEKIIPEPTSRSVCDRIYRLVLDTCSPLTPSSYIQTALNSNLVNALISRFLKSHSISQLSWIHIPSLNFIDEPPELLLAMLVAGASISPESGIRRLSNELYEPLRIATSGLFERDNRNIRDLQSLQTFALLLDIGIWSGDRRQMEISEGFSHVLNTMLRRGGNFQSTQVSEAWPVVSDGHQTLELKWKNWTKAESFSRLVFHIMVRDACGSMSFITQPLLSQAEITLSAPISSDLWTAADSKTWARLYHEKLAQKASYLPSVQDICNENLLLTQWDKIIDTRACIWLILSNLWARIWKYHDLQNSLEAAPHTSCSTMSLVIDTLRNDLEQSIEYFRLVGVQCMEACDPGARMLVEYESMVIYAPIEDIQRLVGKYGEDAALKVQPKMEIWVSSNRARKALWHAGQIFRAAKCVPVGALRDYLAVTVYHVGIIFWAYAILKHNSAPICALQDEEQVHLDGDEGTLVQRFVALGRGTPVIKLDGHISPSGVDEALAINSPCQVMKAINVLIIHGASGGVEEACPDLVRKLSRLIHTLSYAAQVMLCLRG